MSYRTYYKSAWGVGASLALLFLLAGFVPQQEGIEIRRPISTELLTPRPEDMPAPIESLEHGGWSMRAPVTGDAYIRLASVSDKTAKHQQWIHFSENKGRLRTADHQRTAVPSFVSLLPFDGASGVVSLGTTHPVGYGETYSVDGTPLRWLAEKDNATMRSNESPACSLERPTLDALEEKFDEWRLLWVMHNEGTLARAKRYQPLIRKAAQRFNIREILLYALIQTESDFRPTLVSRQSAMGLMQLLPSTAGGEVHRFLHGKTASMTFEDLSKPEINIHFGAAYLHLLLTRHLGGITDQRAREYCALAAYNMGPGRLIRFFGSSHQEAIDAVNALSADEVYTKLTTGLPFAETRNYVARVTRRQEKFKSIL